VNMANAWRGGWKEASLFKLKCSEACAHIHHIRKEVYTEKLIYSSSTLSLTVEEAFCMTIVTGLRGQRPLPSSSVSLPEPVS
jgi:hypothetical protein